MGKKGRNENKNNINEDYDDRRRMQTKYIQIYTKANNNGEYKVV